VFFEIAVPPYGQSAYRVYFRQKLEHNHFKYILTSTSAWGKPFESAIYKLIIPAGVTVDSLSMTPDSTCIQGVQQIFHWKKSNFMPDRDFEVFFR
jgi:hypothetical protein